MSTNASSTETTTTVGDEINMVKKVLDVALSLPEGSVRRAMVGPLREIIAQIVAKAAVMDWFEENKDYAPTKEEIELEKQKEKTA